LGLAVELKDNEPIKGRVGTVGYMGKFNCFFFGLLEVQSDRSNRY